MFNGRRYIMGIMNLSLHLCTFSVLLYRLSPGDPDFEKSVFECLRYVSP